jgi:glycosyltransferase involved in cell wall biosynthesis
MPNIRKYKPFTDYSVTVVISAYNEEDNIRNCILSLMKQTLPSEIIVVDDGSNDQTFYTCEALGVKTLRQNHRGPGSARNLGARNAQGNILLFVDADMQFSPDYVEKLVEPIINGEAIATSHWNETVANWHNPWARCQTWFQRLPDKRRAPLDIPHNVHVYRAVRKDFFLNSGGFSENEGRGDDTSIARRTSVFATIVPDAICYHKNFETIREILTDAIWHGRNISVSRINRTKRFFSILLINNNPVSELLRGLFLALNKKEPRMIPYSIIYTFGLISGAFRALITKYYLK